MLRAYAQVRLRVNYVGDNATNAGFADGVEIRNVTFDIALNWETPVLGQDNISDDADDGNFGRELSKIFNYNSGLFWLVFQLPVIAVYSHHQFEWSQCSHLIALNLPLQKHSIALRVWRTSNIVQYNCSNAQSVARTMRYGGDDRYFRGGENW